MAEIPFPSVIRRHVRWCLANKRKTVMTGCAACFVMLKLLAPPLFAWFPIVNVVVSAWIA